MNIIKSPYYWVSAHRDISFTFEFPLKYPLAAVVENNGFAVFIFFGDGINSLPVGGYLYCDTAPFIGYHKVTEIMLSNWYKTETAYIDNMINNGSISFVTPAVFKLYKGYETGDLAALLPYTKIAEFKPEPNKDGQLVVNISGYVNKIFDVINSTVSVDMGSQSILYNLFNKVVMLIDDVWASENMVLNSAITMLELNRDYVDTGRSINGGSLGNHYLSCGSAFEIIIDGAVVVASKTYEDGEDVTAVEVFDPTGFDSGFKTG